MQGLHAVIFRISKVMDVIGGVVLTLMMLITVTDVILRFVGKPITGTYELVFLGGAVVIACAIPQTSWEGGHVNVDFVLGYLPGIVSKIITVVTRLMGMAFFVLLGWNLIALGTNLYSKEEVSLTLHVPIYPVAYVLGICAFVECLVLLSDLIKKVCEVKHE
ncbi:MAG: TRAP transporter small permease [Deltaproteobacteria bacterium]|nr:TRAP transporter small permease [Pseudomonadota bacterium]